MPFGRVYGALFFFLAAGLFVLPVHLMPPPFRLTELLLAVVMATLALGLLARQAWARWFGITVGVVLVLTRLQLTLVAGSVYDVLILLAAALAVVLLVIPATGNVRPRRSPGETRRSRFAAALGAVSALALAGSVAAFSYTVVTFQRAAAVRPDLANAGIHSVPWKEFGPGLEAARADGKPLLVDFFADWCQPCKVMDRKTFRDPSVVERMTDVVAVRIDAEGQQAVQGYVGEELADRYGVFSYPTIVLMDSSGREIARSRGAKGPAEFLAWLERSLALAADGVTADIPAGTASM